LISQKMSFLWDFVWAQYQTFSLVHNQTSLLPNIRAPPFTNVFWVIWTIIYTLFIEILFS